jgi:hypothetical protein
MGGLVSGIMDLFQGDPAGTQENQLGSLAGYQTGVGEGLITPAAQYEENILSGDPTKTAQAIAPEISANQQQTQQLKNQTAEFSPRSGGTAATIANADTSGRSNLIDLLGKEQSGAASTSLSAGSGLLGQASANIGDVAGFKEERRGETQADIENINKGMNEIASRIMTRGMSSGGNDNISIPEAGSTPDGGGSAGANDLGGGGGGMSSIFDMFDGGGGGGGGMVGG